MNEPCRRRSATTPCWATGDALGNFPQAISHVGLVNAALALTAAQAREGAAA